MQRISLKEYEEVQGSCSETAQKDNTKTANCKPQEHVLEKNQP